MKTLILKERERCGSARYFEPIRIGNYELSIQASDGHYCSPRETLTQSYNYESVELAIFSVNSKRKYHNLDITKSKVFREFPMYNDLMSCSDGNYTKNCFMVFGYVPVNVVLSLINYLYDIENNKRGEK